MKNNIRRLLLTFEALSDLGPAITAERDFSETAPLMLASLMDALDAREGALFRFTDKPAMMASIAARGFASFPHPAVIPLLPKHVHALCKVSGPRQLSSDMSAEFLSSNGNVAPELLKCLAPLLVGGKLVGMIALGQRADGAPYESEELETVGLLSHYISVAVHNNTLTETLAQRVTENLKLMATVHNFYDTTLEAFAAAIDFKHVNIHGHSLRVGRYAAGIAEAMGSEASEAAGVRAAGYLHDIGKVAVDKYLFGKTTALDPQEFREMADHTVLGHEIVQGVHFPWPKIPDVVRWHHERSDGTGYPDKLHQDDIPEAARLIAVADSFDAMTSERPYRQPMTVGEALNEIVKLTPTKFDANAVQGLLIQVRRDTVANSNPQLLGKWAPRSSDKEPFLDLQMRCDLGPSDVDHYASMLLHKVNKARVYSA
ncbi:MAG TPA: HD domain-containing phosphohydrolase [Clostridia bacterium]|nr:HD domain-containing phosphohydrolase [Clostridia bacterium]